MGELARTDILGLNAKQKLSGLPVSPPERFGVNSIQCRMGAVGAWISQSIGSQHRLETIGRQLIAKLGLDWNPAGWQEDGEIGHDQSTATLQIG